MIIRWFIIYITIGDQFTDTFMISCCRLNLTELHQLPSRYTKRSTETAPFPKGKHGDVETDVGWVETIVFRNWN